MKESRAIWKVGLFVLIGLTLLGAMLLQFTKGATLFKPSYEIRLLAKNVGSIKPHATVAMAGVQVGSVVDADLNPDGRSVTIRARILKKYTIREDAIFVIDQAGFLGDQYISITPGPNVAPPLTNGSVVQCQEPFNLQDTARSAAVLMKRLDETAQIVNQSMSRMDRILLAEQNLVNLTNTLANLHTMSKEFTGMATGINGLVHSNAATVTTALSNLVAFTVEANRLAAQANEVLATNGSSFKHMAINLESASASASNLLRGLETGQGVAGKLLTDKTLAIEFTVLSSNLTVLSSNLNKYGLLYRPKAVKTSAKQPAKMPYPGKNPVW